MKSRYLIVFLIIAVAAFFRFYKFYNYLFFTMDQEYEALIVQNILSGRHFPLIGVNASDSGLYLGPAFIYFATIPYILFAGNPAGLSLFASLIGLLVCLILYKVAGLMFNKKIGIFASFFFASSSLMAFYDRQFWNPTLVPLFSLLLGFVIYKILQEQVGKIVWLSLLFGLGLQSHLSILVFLPLIIWTIYLKRKVISGKLLFFSFLLFLITQLPIILFDIRHNFINLKAIISLVSDSSFTNSLLQGITSRASLFSSAIGRFFYIGASPDLMYESGQCLDLSIRKNNQLLGTIISFILIIIGVSFFKKKLFPKNKKIKNINISNNFLILIGIFAVTFLAIIFYNRSIFEYYFLYFFPWLAIFVAILFDFLINYKFINNLKIIFLILFLIINLISLITTTSAFPYTDKLQAIQIAAKYINNRPYHLESIGECARFGGYRYLFGHFFKNPSSSYMDSYFVWLYPHTIDKKNENSVTVLLSLIDPRFEKSKRAKLNEDKFRFLHDFEIESSERINNIGIQILSLTKD